MSGRYPNASWKGDGKTSGPYTDVPFRFVVHTTETTGVPGYANGGSAPHVTYLPKTREFVQHTDFDQSARALRNESGGVETNKAGALQLEIACYSAHGIAQQSSSRLWVGDLPQSAYDDIAGLAVWLIDRYGVQNKIVLPRPVPKYGPDSPARMTPTEWNTFNGLCGHFEVPENAHWDPGAFDFPRLCIAIGELMGWKSDDGYDYLDSDEWGIFTGDVQWTINSGLMVGSRDKTSMTARFDQSRQMTRGETAAVLHRLAKDSPTLMAEVED